MRAPAFWWRQHPSSLANLLRPASALYGTIAARRMKRAGEAAPVPVICIGNFTVGGAGKTPAALALAPMLAARGHKPAFLTRGYGGRLAGPIRVDPTAHDAADVGDEPLLLARAFPTIVAHDRPGGARLAAREGASLVIMDDGLQNPSLVKTLSIAIVDGATGIGNGVCFPGGPLRAPLVAQWPLIEAVIIVGEGAPGTALAREAAARSKPGFLARLEPDQGVADRLRGKRVFAFAGIGRPSKFFATLTACGAAVAQTRSFADHHPYTVEEINEIAAEADRNGLAVVTTEKDWARIAGLPGLGTTRDHILTLPIRLVVADENGLRQMLSRVV